MKILALISCLFLYSCNVIQIVEDNQAISDDFYKQTNYNSTLKNDIFAFWRFNEAQASPKISSFNGISLTDTVSGGIPTVTGVRGTALNCQGLSSGSAFLTTNTAFTKSATDDYAFSFWAYLPANVTGGCSAYNTIFNFNGSYIMFENTDCQGDFSDIQVNIGGTNVDLVDVVDFGAGTWHHFVINVFGGGTTVEAYVDGSFKTSNSITATSISSNFIELCSGNAGTLIHNGKLDSVGIWNRTLTTSEISELFSTNNPLD
jgi:hypothetical protein